MSVAKKKARPKTPAVNAADAYRDAMQAVVQLALSTRGEVDATSGLDAARRDALGVVSRILGILARPGGPTATDALYLASIAAHAEEPGTNGERYPIALPIVEKAATRLLEGGDDPALGWEIVLFLAVELATRVDHRFGDLTLRTETVVQILRSYAPKKPKKGQRTAHALLADLALMVSAFGWSRKMTREKARKTIQVDMARRKRLSDTG